MDQSNEHLSFSERRIIDITIKLALVIGLIYWCIGIVLPFTGPVLWAAILAITLYPLHTKLTKLFRGRKVLSSIIIIGILVLLLIVPAVWLVGSMAVESKNLITAFNNGTLIIPTPDASVADWPVIGKPIFNSWKLISSNLSDAIITYRNTLIIISEKLLSSIMAVTSGFLMFIFSLVISGFLLVKTDKIDLGALKFSNHMLGDKGEEFLEIVVQTVRNVAKGILGVAFIQFLLFGFAFVIAGIPFAALFAFLCFLIAIVQLPTAIVSIPVIIYLYSVKPPLQATIFTIILVVFSFSDSILKPILMGKNAPVPILVIFLGSIGGFIFTGFMGLFTGAIVLSLGYKLLGMWLQYNKTESQKEVNNIVQ